MNVLNKINIKPYGYSHGDKIGFELRGINSGFKIDFNLIDQLLMKRKGLSKFNTTRSESEKLIILNGIKDSVTTGGTIKIEIEQSNFRTSDYQFGVVRPGHADLSAYQKYGKDYQYSGGGQFSGRLTILYVIAGEIARQIYSTYSKTQVLGHISQVSDIEDCYPTNDQLLSAIDTPFPFCSQEKLEIIESKLKEIKSSGDSVGGKIRVRIINVERNYGSDFFGSLESKLSFLMYSIPAVKAVEFGIGEQFAYMRGTEVREKLLAKDGILFSETNFNGGINGGIANIVNDIEFRLTIKPTSSIFQELDTVRYNDDGTFANVSINLTGRHDAFIANRALWPAIGLTYLLLLDMEMEYVK